MCVPALDGVIVTYNADGKIADVSFYQVKFYTSPDSQVRLPQHAFDFNCFVN